MLAHLHAFHSLGFLRATGMSVLLTLIPTSCGHVPPDSLPSESSAATGSHKSGEVEEQLTATLNEARKLGTGNPLHLSTLYTLATFYRERKDYTEAEALYQELLSIKEEIYGPNHPDVAFILEEYASLLRETHRSLEAEWLTLRAEAIRSGNTRP